MLPLYIMSESAILWHDFWLFSRESSYSQKNLNFRLLGVRYHGERYIACFWHMSFIAILGVILMAFGVLFWVPFWNQRRRPGWHPWSDSFSEILWGWFRGVIRRRRRIKKGFLELRKTAWLCGMRKICKRFAFVLICVINFYFILIKFTLIYYYLIYPLWPYRLPHVAPFASLDLWF